MFKLFNKKPATTEKDAPKRFFSVLLSSSFVQAAMWGTGETVKVLAKSSLKPFFNENDLLVKLDQCLQELGPEGESVHQTLFHLDSSYVIGADISPEKKDIFRKMTEMLQLESLGFVTNTESTVNAKLAVAPETQRQLVVEFTLKKVIYSLYEGKALVETLSGDPEEDFAEQFKGVLVQLAGKLGTDYTSYFDSAAPTDAGKESLLTVDYISSQITSDELNLKLEKLPASLPVKTEVLGSEVFLSYVLVPSATIIARSYGWLSEPEPEPVPAAASQPPEEAVAAAEPLPVLSRQRQVEVPTVEESDFVPVEKPPRERKPLSSGAKAALICTVVILLIIAIGGGVFWWMVSSGSAQVTLTPEKDYIVKTMEVIIDPTAKEADFEKATLPGKISDASVEIELDVATTGEKNVGEKATGKVEIINKKEGSRTIPKGTELENGKVSFVTKDEITVDGAKVEETNDGKKTTYSKKDVDVVAVTVGTSGNVAKDTSLRVGSDSKDDLEAVAKEAFTGGTDKTVKVFSQSDYDSALKQARDELADEATKKIDSKKGDTYQVPKFDELKVVSAKFDAEVGAETDSVLLTVKGEVPVISYKLDELEPLAEAALKKDLPAGYKIVGELDLVSGVNEKKTAKSTDLIYIDADLSQMIESAIDTEAVKTAIIGQTLSKVENILDNYDGVKAYEIVWSNELSKTVTGKLPSDADKLVVQTAQE